MANRGCSIDAQPRAEPWLKIGRRSVPSASYRDLVEVEYRLPDGSTETFVSKNERPAVAVVALTPSLRIVLARQFRPGPGSVVDELPGGGVETGESFESAACRGLAEETGSESVRWIPLGRALKCAYRTVHREGFRAIACRRASPAASDPTEWIDVVEKSIPEFIEQLRRGATTDGEIAWMGLFEAGLVTAVWARPTVAADRGGRPWRPCARPLPPARSACRWGELVFRSQ